MIGDNRQTMKQLPDNSVDSIVTDPPYELGFMGKSWDASGIAYDKTMWSECLRVLKPGGHLIAFSGSRTYHRMTVAIEDAGFEIRDQMMWVYGSGFPKSHNISKALDKQAGAEREIVGSKLGRLGMAKDGSNQRQWSADALHGKKILISTDITAPATDEAKKWDGWGTALKPAHEPICLARKPLEGTVADNVLKWGVGGLNIDGCRIGNEKSGWNGLTSANDNRSSYGMRGTGNPTNSFGRFPANLMHDGSQEVLDLFPETGPTPNPYVQKSKSIGIYGPEVYHDRTSTHYGDSGSAARFFYCPKASKKDRDEGCEDFDEKRESDREKDDGVGGDNPRNRTNNPRKNFHPTVKPTDLMRYLCRLVTPAAGTVLDPFMGSGSTGKAAMLEGFSFIGCELSEEYAKIAEARIKAAEAQT